MLTRKQAKLTGNILIITGAALVIGALALYFYNAAEDLNAKSKGDDITSKVKNIISVSEDNEDKDTSNEKADPDKGDDQFVASISVEGEPVIGYLSIPDVNLEMVVFGTWNNTLLKKGACRYYGSCANNDLVIAGHNYKSTFGKLHKIETGAEVFFTDANGKVHSYVVKDKEVIGGIEVERMTQSGNWDMTLYTCTYGGQDRLAVRCRKTD